MYSLISVNSAKSAGVEHGGNPAHGTGAVVTGGGWHMLLGYSLSSEVFVLRLPKVRLRC